MSRRVMLTMQLRPRATTTGLSVNIHVADVIDYFQNESRNPERTHYLFRRNIPRSRFSTSISNSALATGGCQAVFLSSSTNLLLLLTILSPSFPHQLLFLPPAHGYPVVTSHLIAIHTQKWHSHFHSQHCSRSRSWARSP